MYRCMLTGVVSLLFACLFVCASVHHINASLLICMYVCIYMYVCLLESYYYLLCLLACMYLCTYVVHMHVCTYACCSMYVHRPRTVSRGSNLLLAHKFCA
eukprot:jgi/Psemu1/208006/e_gw1.455.21.1